MIEIEAGKLKGVITIQKGCDPDDMREVASFPNMILDSGLIRYGQRNPQVLLYCNVGSSSEPVAANQTGLLAKLYHSSQKQGSDQRTAVTSGVDEPYLRLVRTIRFSPQGVSYNVAEVGFGWNTSNACFNRALVMVDGAPSNISVLDNEYLDVTIELRVYPPVNDFTGTFTPTGRDTAERMWTARSGGVGSLQYETNGGWSCEGGAEETAGHGHWSSGALPALFGVLAGGAVIGSPCRPTPVAGEPAHVLSMSAGTGYANGTIRTVSTMNVASYRFNIEFDPPFIKTNEDTFSVSFKYTWGRK